MDRLEAVVDQMEATIDRLDVTCPRLDRLAADTSVPDRPDGVEPRLDEPHRLRGCADRERSSLVNAGPVPVVFCLILRHHAPFRHCTPSYLAVDKADPSGPSV